jgi:glycerol-3-phosphate acyltransferase PlsY
MNKIQINEPRNINQKTTTILMWRKFWHVVGGSVFPIVALFVASDLLFILLGAITTLFVSWEIIRLGSPNINQWMVYRLGFIMKKKERFQPTGTTYLLLASLVVFFFFEKYVAITSLFFLSIGDFMAAVIGQKFGRHKLFKKSIEGSLAYLVSCILIGVVIMQVGSGMSIFVILVGAFSAMIVEFLPIPIDDNFTVPMVSAGMMTLATLV